MIKLGEEGLLFCPKCGGINLHQTESEIYQRDKEDSDTGLHVWTNRMAATVDADMEGNPSQRRDGICIQFYCEHCGEDNGFQLSIIQHKGSTFLKWDLE